ncbi:class F sortase [Radiobacillus kanasensis]|uniref:class F sortase n=1 Tax=Radiobacillus kanasensis TaxID=2844358 RepID=UPI001E391EBF|nr:class F sortase [Radiobacillus kanasensis]UFT99050.1 class F sortase [Radiobacillus kanasensis]
MRLVLYVLLLVLLGACSQSAQPNQQNNESANKEIKEEVQATSLEKQQSYKNVDTDIPIIKQEQLGIIPSSISIPAIDVEAKVHEVGLLENGQMGVPEDFTSTGWYEPGTMPGDQGSAVIAGHVDDKSGPAVFFYLKELEAGNQVIITGAKGEKLTFEVVGKEVFPQNDAPVEDIFGYTSRRMLNLITCTGPFDRSKGGHIERLVVYTELKEQA